MTIMPNGECIMTPAETIDYKARVAAYVLPRHAEDHRPLWMQLRREDNPDRKR